MHLADRAVRVPPLLLALLLAACGREAATGDAVEPVPDVGSTTAGEERHEPVALPVADTPAHEGPTDDEGSGPPTDQPSQATGLTGGRPACGPDPAPPCDGAPAGGGVDDTVAAGPTGTVTIIGVVREWNTRCTSSEPPSCSSDLVIHDEGRPRHKLTLVGQQGSTGYGCGDDCCTIATGPSYAVTGVLDGGQLRVESICRVQ